MPNKLKEILDNINIGDLEHGDVSLVSKIGDDEISKLVSQIKQMYEGCVPAELVSKFAKDDDKKKWNFYDGQIDGFNACRSQVKVRIEEKT
jgi:hypothetical protein